MPLSLSEPFPDSRPPVYCWEKQTQTAKETVKKEMFEYCISLGENCNVAGSMGQLGLRSAAGPFDWMVSGYRQVLEQLENDFADFMQKENLEPYPTEPLRFRDRKYGFSCIHDIKNSYEEEIDSVIEKYHRRAERFMQMSRCPTVFFRCMMNESEVGYINENWQRAKEAVKRFNRRNEIVYILSDRMPPLTNQVLSFRLSHWQPGRNYLEIRYFFHQSEELLAFCRNLLCEESRRRNLEFDAVVNKPRDAVSLLYRMLRRNTDCTEIPCIEEALGAYREGLYIWGTRMSARNIYRYLRENHYKLSGLIDPDGEERLRNLTLQPSDMDDSTPVFIPFLDREQIDAAAERIRRMRKKNKILSFYDMDLSQIAFDKTLLE